MILYTRCVVPDTYLAREFQRNYRVYTNQPFCNWTSQLLKPNGPAKLPASSLMSTQQTQEIIAPHSNSFLS